MGPAMKHKLVAVVDDDPSICEIVACLLRQHGYQAQKFVNGRDFLARLHPWIGGVVLGIVMPHLGGVETLREMRRRGIKLPTMTISGGASQRQIEEARRLGAREHLPKPFTPKQFGDAVNRV